MTSADFIKNKGWSEDLRTQLENPVFKKACEVVMFESIPHVDNLGVASDAAGNAKLQQLAGMKQFLRMLGQLADGKQPTTHLSTRRLYTEEDRETLVQQQQETK